MLDLTPLKKHRDYRLIFLSQVVSYLGNMVSYIAVPYQIYHLTQSNFMVGLVSAIELIPVFIFGLYGGSVADRIDRRRLVIYAESIMCVTMIGLTLNALAPSPNIPAIFVLVFILQSASSYHRPAMEAMIQKMIPKEDFPAVAALSSFTYGLNSIVGPAFGGWLIFKVGIFGAYMWNSLTFVMALTCSFLLSQNYAVIPAAKKNFWAEIKEGVVFAWRNQPLLGSYIIDIVAMTFAFPVALYPAMVKESSNEEMLGVIYAAMAVGTLIALAFGKLPTRSLYRGKAIVFAAGSWGLAIVVFGLTTKSLYAALFFLILAGAADTVSGLNRRILWNEIIPNSMRGRLAGIEMISYLSGPLLGNFRAGTMASFTSVPFAIISGGVICVLAIAICAWKLPVFWQYKSPTE